MNGNGSEWNVLSNVLGEALLDVERTFMDLVDHRSAATSEGDAGLDEPVLHYLEAWNRLEDAQRRLAQTLGAGMSSPAAVRPGPRPRHLIAVRNGSGSHCGSRSAAALAD